MRTELKNRLINENIELFPNVYQEQTLDIGDGWFQIVNQLLQNLKTYPVILTKISDEIGSLQVNYQITRNIDNSLAENIKSFIDIACKASKSSCSVCGSHANINKISPKNGILCDEHKENYH